jgi:FkbM family methyltransferase
MKMNVPHWIIECRYNPRFIKLAKFFHIDKFVKKIFYQITLPSDRILKVSLFGYKARFYVDKPEEMGFIENVLIDKREGEIRILQKIFEFLDPGDVVYDIGANVGTHAIFLAKKVGGRGQVFAFEPDDMNYDILQKNITLNDVTNIIIMKCALGNSFGEGLLHIAGPESSLLNLPLNGSILKKVKIIPGDYFVYDKNFPVPNLIKIDTEGYEYYVIQGLEKTLKQEKCQTVFCEIHPTKLPREIMADNVIDLLKSYGFNEFESYCRGETLHSFFYKTGSIR